MIASESRSCNPHVQQAVQDIRNLAEELQSYVEQAARDSLPAHEVERNIWRHVLSTGRAAMDLLFALLGNGDRGETVTLPDGGTLQRLPETHARAYRSIFGDFRLERTVYGSREGQKIVFVPLDNRLQLPASDYSYVLQEWDQALGSEFAFGRVAATLFDILGLKQSVDSLEHMNRAMAESAVAFREARPCPAAEAEAELVVVQADGKGIVMRREADEPKIHAHRRKGDKANQKRMAVVGTIYTVDRLARTPETVVESLFRDPKDKKAPGPARPVPQHKHVWASLTHTHDGAEVLGSDVVFSWLGRELAARNLEQAKETIYLMDGQESLWQTRRNHLPWRNAVEILDLLHVTPRLWQAAHLFYQEKSDKAEAFVRERLLRVLQGGVGYVVGGLRQMATKRGLAAAKQKRLDVICAYLENNAYRMRYDEFLAKGYPIASGVIEGACRHYVKDRMERAGMHWKLAGAQAMLNVRSEYLNGDWRGFQQFRIEQETERLYPHRQLATEPSWTLAA